MIRMKTDEDRISDMVSSAMETGNQAEARRLLAEYRDAFPDEVDNVRRSVVQDYGIHL